MEFCKITEFSSHFTSYQYNDTEIIQLKQKINTHSIYPKRFFKLLQDPEFHLKDDVGLEITQSLNSLPKCSMCGKL